MNIFEGARRVLYIFLGVMVIGTLIHAITYKPSVYINYSLSDPSSKPVRSSSSCPYDAGNSFFTVNSNSGVTTYINLCLLTMDFGEDKGRLVPYKIDENNMIWGSDNLSREVSEYKDNLERNFTLSEDDNNFIERESSRLYWKNWKDSFKYLGLAMIVITGFSWAIGWVIRGFMGIPRGMDKPDNEQNNRLIK